jgi:predicted deacylase
MPVQFGGTVAKSGSKAFGSVTVAQSFDGSPVQMPFAILNGHTPGPKLWLIAGTHGDEIEGIVAVQRILRDTDPARLSGSIVAILAANPSAVGNQSRDSAIDGKDLNRAFPGDANGTFTDRLAHFLFTELKQALAPDDLIVSLHGGGRTLYSAGLIEVSGTGDEREQKSMELAQAACNPNLGIIARIEERSGPWATLYRGTLNRELGDAAPMRCITIEAGGLGRLTSEDLSAHYDGIRNVMFSAGMLDGKPLAPRDEIIITRENLRLNPTHRGFWLAHVQIRERVEKDALLAEVVDIYGKVLEQIRSPFDGLVLYMRGYGLVDPESSSLGDRYGVNVARYP